MRETKVGEIRKLITVEPTVALESEDIRKIIKMFIDNPIIRAVYIVDKSHHLQGIITIQDILKKISLDFSTLSSIYSDLSFSGYEIASSHNNTSARAIMDPEFYFVTDEDPIEKAFNLLFANNAGEIPVVDKDEKLIGDLNVIELLVLWYQTHTEAGG